MAENPTHLEIYSGQTAQLDVEVTPPTDPTPIAGDMYVDSTAGAESIAIHNESGWVYISLQK